MQLLLFLLIFLLVSLRVSCGCPTWRWFNYSSGVCQCGYDIMGTIKCSEVENGSVYARFDACVSWDNHSETLLTSLCKYKRSHASVTDRVFFELPHDPRNLSYDECALNNREGFFCSKCKEGFAPSMYVLSGVCINCSYCLQNPWSFFLFYFSENVPLIFFYTFIMTFHINIVSGPLLGYVIFCQVHINSIHVYPNIWRVLLSHSSNFLRLWHMNVLLPLAGIWNLNFFAMFLPHLCYGCNINSLSGIVLEYASIVYIFVLVTISLLFSRCKDKVSSFRCCRVVHQCFLRWRKNLTISDSVIHALATFTALFVAKVGTISTRLLSATHMYGIHGSQLKMVLSFEPSIEALSRQHAPYAAVAYVSIFSFAILPALFLCMYPNRHFQALMVRCCGPRKRLALAIFVDTLSCGYRDGLDGGRDWRRVYPLSLIFMTGTLFIFFYFFVNLPETYFVMMFPVFTFLSFCILYYRPCKATEMNVSLSFHLIIVALSALTLALWVQDELLDGCMLEIFLTLCLTLPHVVMLLWLLSNIVRRCQSLRNCYQSVSRKWHYCLCSDGEDFIN